MHAHTMSTQAPAMIAATTMSVESDSVAAEASPSEYESGAGLGGSDGEAFGVLVGAIGEATDDGKDGAGTGLVEGTGKGWREGTEEGRREGKGVGVKDGAGVGVPVGSSVGAGVGVN